jgi:hypothetical protein
MKTMGSRRKRKRDEAYFADLQSRLEMRAEKEIRRQLARFDTTSDIGKCRLATFISKSIRPA